MNQPKRIISLESAYHKVLSVDKNIYYYCCPLDCQLCQDWSKPHQTWKSFTFFPYHCHLCQGAGYPDDFYLCSRFFLCRDCYGKYLKRLDQVLSRRRSEKDYKYLLERKENF